jgi:peroxiredoxin
MKTCLAAFAAVTVLVAPLYAQSFAAFGPRPQAAFSVPAFSDQDITGLIGTLDRLLAAAPPGPAWRDPASEALWLFARRLQAARVSRAQETRVLAHLDVIARSRPEAAALVTGPRRMVSALAVGKTAPEIVGQDLEGHPFRLSEFRNKVVLLVFSAEWCAICRVQAPYERFLLDKYTSWPFAILGVETGSSREAARLAQATSPLTHRSWWDEPRTGESGGPIGGAWNVIGWPATYLIDGDGVIQFVDLREETLMIAVRQLVEAQADRDFKSQRAK